MTRYLRFIGLISIAFLSLSLAAWGQTALKIGVIDTQRVLDEYKRATDAMEKLDREQDRLRAKGQGLVDELRAMQEKLSKQRKFLDEDQLTQTENDIRIKQTEIKSFTTTAQDTLDDMQQTLFDPVIAEVEEYILELGKQENFDMLLRKQLAVLYVKPEYDLTDRVIKELNAKFAKESQKKPSRKSSEPAPKSENTTAPTTPEAEKK